MKIKRDQITGVILIAIGVFFAILTSQFETPFTMEYPGPKMLPGIAEFGMIVCGAGVFVKGCTQKDADKVFVNVRGWIRILVSFAILCVYILGMKYLGFLVCTPFITFALVTFFTKESVFEGKLVTRIIYSVLVTAIIYVMYVKLFSMGLPTGLFFE